MSCISKTNKPHVVVLPHPAQGHINPMLSLAKLFHHKGFYVTFVNTERNHQDMLKSRGPNSLDGLEDFTFQTMPDCLSLPETNSAEDVHALCHLPSKTFYAPFCDFMKELKTITDSPSSNVPPISCVVGDTSLPFIILVANQFKINYALLWTASICSYLGIFQYPKLINQGLVPLKDVSQITDGFLETTTIEWTKGMKNIRLRDLPSFIRTTKPDNAMLNFMCDIANKSKDASAVILNTFDALDEDVLDSLSSIHPFLYTIGPLHKLANQIENEEVKAIGANLWGEESEAIEWLNSKEPNSVIYVNFGSVAVMKKELLIEFAWGLANSGKHFLWVTRPDLVVGDSTILPIEFVKETTERSLIVSWCCQEQVLNHPSIGGFLTHSGWNSTIESICAGVPMICWPFFFDQQTNCHYCCTEWGIGMEIDNNVKRNEVEKLVRELMDGDKGKKMKENAMELKRKGEEAYKLGGSAWKQLDKLINEVLLSNMKQI